VNVKLQVCHLQCLNEMPFKCWVIIEESGEVLCAHCNCMAGLRETALYRIKEVQTCTRQQCEWIIPASLKSVDYLTIKYIDFTSARGKKRKLDNLIDLCKTTKDRGTLNHSNKSTNSKMELYLQI